MAIPEESRFSYAVSIILFHEGGLSNNRNDPGGITKYGISLRFLKSINPEATEDDIKSLNKSEAIKLYRTYFWDKYEYNRISPIRIATKIFDMAVNMGPEEAHKILQKSINSLVKESLVIDGILGPKTIALTNAVPSTYLHEEICEHQKAYYYDLVQEKPELKPFLPDWLDRAEW